MKVDIEALKKAVKAMDRLGEDGSFLQAGVVSAIRRLVATSADLSASDRDVVANFLSEADSDREGASDSLSESNPSEITGILKQMLETMMKDNKQLLADENNALKQYESLHSAKSAQKSTLTAEIKTKTERLSAVNLQMVEDRGKLEDTKKALANNVKLQEDLSAECKSRRAEHDEEVSTRAEELKAISDTIKLLNDEVTSRLFKRTMPFNGATSLLQIEATPAQLRGEALDKLR